jgi:uncharacterized membrane protein YphA (DoxX/SURF4 family)
MKIATRIAGGLLGALFVVIGSNFFLNFIPLPPPPPADSPAGMFMGAAMGTGFLAFVKTFEIIGGLLVAIPRTRAIGLMILTPIVVNILAFHIFILKEGVFDPPVVAVTLLTAFLLFSHRSGIFDLVANRG